MKDFYKPYDCDLREYEARLASSREIWVVFGYIWRMIMPGETLQKPTSDRIKCLDNDELLKLLAGELKMCVKCTYEFVNVNRHKPNSTPNYQTFESWIVSNEYKYNDTILDKIEREHWRANPDECIWSYFGKAKRWKWKSCFF